LNYLNASTRHDVAEILLKLALSFNQSTNESTNALNAKGDLHVSSESTVIKIKMFVYLKFIIHHNAHIKL